MKRIMIDVTAEHIAIGIPEKCESCPIALALIAAVPELGMPRVFEEEIHFLRTEGHRTYRRIVNTPYRVEAWVKRFDKTGSAQPFRFRLELPDDE